MSNKFSWIQYLLKLDDLTGGNNALGPSMHSMLSLINAVQY